MAAGVRMRAEPNSEAEVLATLPSGATVALADSGSVEADDLVWYQLRFGDVQGWVASGPDGDWLTNVTNGLIGFGCVRCGPDGTYAAVAVEPDGSPRHLLLPAFGSPTWSPDGTKVVIEELAGAGSLTLMNADGTDAIELGPGVGAEWSPDGEWLAFSNHEDRTLVVIDPDGQRFDLTVNDFGAPGSMSWSPDSSQLALVAIDCEGCPVGQPLAGDIPSAIFLFTPPMGSVDRVVEPGYYGRPAWSPDGSSLTYFWTDLSASPDGTQIRQLNIADGTVTTLASGQSLIDGSISPDGSRLVMSQPEGIVVTDVDGGNPQVIVPRTDDMNPTPQRPTWSPDGRWILIDMAWVTGDAIESWIVRADGSGEPQRVSDDAYEAAWQPVLVPLAR